MDSLRYGALMLAAGVGIPILAALNAQLGQRIGSPVAAASVLFLVACAASLALAALTGHVPRAAVLAVQPPALFLGGLLVAFYVLSVTFVAPRFGVGNAILCVLMGQMLSAAVIDHFALFGAARHGFGGLRALGLLTMAAGLVMTRSG